MSKDQSKLMRGVADLVSDSANEKQSTTNQYGAIVFGLFMFAIPAALVLWATW